MPERTIAAVYHYQDEQGVELYRKERYIPKDFAQFLPDGTPGLNGTRRVLYRLPELIAADPKRWVYVTEGEKATDALIQLGSVATSPGGASSWKPEFAASLRGRRVVILVDNDPDGIRFGKLAAHDLETNAATVLLMPPLPNAPAKGDVVDFLETHTLSDLEQLVKARRPAPTVIAKVGLGYRGAFPLNGVELALDRLRETHGEIHGELFVRELDRPEAAGHLFGGNFNASSIAARATLCKYLQSRVAIDWPAIIEQFCHFILRAERVGPKFQTVGNQPSPAATIYAVDPILPYGKAAILFAAGGSFKSTLAAAIVTSMSTRTEMIPGWHTTPGAALVLDWEDDSSTWNERVKALALGRGISPPAIHYRRMARPLADDYESVARFVGEQQIMLLVLDSIMLASGASREGNWTDATTRLFTALREMRITALLIDHVAGKELGSDQLAFKPYGDVYKSNLARNVYQLKKEHESTGNRTELVLHHTKQNGNRLADIGLAVTIDEQMIRFDRTEITAPDLIKGLPLQARIVALLRRGSQPSPAIASELAVTLESVRTVFSRDQQLPKPTFIHRPDGSYGLASLA